WDTDGMRRRHVAGALLGAFLLLSCSSGGGDTSSGGGASGGGGESGGGASSGANGGSPGGSLFASDASVPSSGHSCIDTTVGFERLTPTIIVLVDRSGSMTEDFGG